MLRNTLTNLDEQEWGSEGVQLLAGENRFFHDLIFISSLAILAKSAGTRGSLVASSTPSKHSLDIFHTTRSMV